MGLNRVTGDDDADCREEGANVDDRPKRWSLNLSRYAYSPEAKAVIARATLRALEVEQAAHLRKNRRRPEDHRTFVLTMDAVLSDLMYRHITHPGEELFISRSNRALSEPLRYRQRARTKQLPVVLDLLARPELGWLAQQVADKGAFGGTATLVC